MEKRELKLKKQVEKYAADRDRLRIEAEDLERKLESRNSIIEAIEKEVREVKLRLSLKAAETKVPPEVLSRIDSLVKEKSALEEALNVCFRSHAIY
jgi:uncharacterized protein YgbK (DUF1537 family)